PSIEGDRNDYALELPLRSGKDKNLLPGWRAQPGMLGVRLTFHRDTDRPWLTDGSADWFWPQAERHAIPVMVHAPERLAELGVIAERHPGLTLIVDHMGFARATIDAETNAAAARIRALARYPNVSVKVSALPCFSTEPYPFGNLREPLKRVIEAFGPRRAFW